MDGYTIPEAASILGVSTERIWELVARGVLAAEPEGEGGMRVFLQPRATASPPVADGGGNGDGERRARSELSPFRELLTEFRSLTERYGQALLALGEARGEVASLRSRVELLEARMDLRLPSSAGEPRALPAWTATPVAPSDERQVEPIASVTVSPVEAGTGEEDESETVDTPPARPDAAETAAEPARPAPKSGRRRRVRSSKGAVSGIAEALARADDPSLAAVPGAEADEPTAEAEAPQAEASGAPQVIDDAGFAIGVEEGDGGEGQEAAVVAAPPPDGVRPEVGEGEPRAPAIIAAAADAPESPYTAAFEEPDWLSEDELVAFEPTIAGDAPAPPAVEPSEPDAPALDEQEDAEAEGIATAAASETEVETEVAAEPEVEPEPDAPALDEQEDPAAEGIATAAASETEVEIEAAAEAPPEAGPEPGPEPGAEPRAVDGVSETEVEIEAAAEAPVAAVADEPDEAGEQTPARDAVQPRPAAAWPAWAPPETADAPHPNEDTVMWLGFDQRTQDDYAAELEMPTPGWRGADEVRSEQPAPVEPPEEGPPPAADLGGPEVVASEASSERPTAIPAGVPPEDEAWHPGEIEAIRSLLARSNALQPEPPAGGDATVAVDEEGPEPTDVAAPTSAVGAEQRSAGEPAQPDAVSPRPSMTLPGADELGEALAALDSIGREHADREPGPAPVRSEWPSMDLPPLPGDAAEERAPFTAERAGSQPPTATESGGAEAADLPTAPGSFHDPGLPAAETDPEWLREVRSPAARAYRRLRRIFPG